MMELTYYNTNYTTEHKRSKTENCALFFFTFYCIVFEHQYVFLLDPSLLTQQNICICINIFTWCYRIFKIDTKNDSISRRYGWQWWSRMEER